MSLYSRLDRLDLLAKLNELNPGVPFDLPPDPFNAPPLISTHQVYQRDFIEAQHAAYRAWLDFIDAMCHLKNAERQAGRDYPKPAAPIVYRGGT